MKETKLALLFCYQRPEERASIHTPPLHVSAMYFYKPQLASCHAPASKPILFPSGGPSAALSKDPSNSAPLSKREMSFSPGLCCCFQPPLLLPPPPQFLFPENSILHLNHLCVFISDSETTEDETTEPQMETKEGPGRHQDKAGRRGPSGMSSQISLRFMCSYSTTFSFFFSLLFIVANRRYFQKDVRSAAYSVNLIYIVNMIYCSTNTAAKNTLLQHYDSMHIDRFNGGVLSAWPKPCVG